MYSRIIGRISMAGPHQVIGIRLIQSSFLTFQRDYSVVQPIIEYQS